MHCPLPLAPPSCLLPPFPTLLGCDRASVWVPWCIQHIPIGCFTYGNVYMLLCYSLHLSHPLLPLHTTRVHKSVLCVCMSVAALQIGSSVLSFYIPYICVHIKCLSLCDLFGFMLFGILCTSHTCISVSFFWFGKFSAIMSSNKFLIPFYNSVPFWMSIRCTLVCFIESIGLLNCFHFFF